jgi:Flp pilus assembly protein CpaB
MSLKLQRIMWFIAGNVVGLAALLIVMLIVKPAGLTDLTSDLPRPQATDAHASTAPLGVDTVGVVVVARDLDAGTILSKSNLKLEPMPKEFANEKLFIDLDKVLGHKTNKQLKAGDVVSRDMLAN